MPKKVDLNRVPIPKQEPAARRKNFSEVALGYGEEEAIEEASRCLQCPKPTCKDGCPVNVDIPEFIEAVRDRNMVEAVRILKNKKGAPIAIGRLERYVADWERAHPEIAAKQEADYVAGGRKVAVVGSGPAGLTCAADLARMGHEVTIFEALHVAGGVLMYGIPEFRLPKQIVQGEVDYVKSLGVEIKLDHVIGKIASADELLESGYDAVFLAPGAGAPMFLNIPGENLNNIYSANEFLTRTNLMKAYLFPQWDTPVKRGRRVAVFGGGNVAMDASRCALRLGAEEVYVIYRRSKVEMPARL